MRSRVVLAALLVTLGSCGGGGGTGTLAVEVWGEEYIEQGIPANVFADGWSVTFTRFLVTIGDVSLARGDGAPDVTDATQRVYDLTRAGPFPLLIREAPAGAYDHTGYAIAPAGAAAEAGNGTAADLDLMRQGGLSVYVEGSATDGAITKTFAWGFATATTYTACESLAVVERGGAATVQLTIHGDHLFYDDLFAADPNVTFATLATADADADGEVTPAELEAYDLRALPNYGTGSTGIENLWDFVTHLTGTLGHIDGEGHCHT